MNYWDFMQLDVPVAAAVVSVSDFCRIEKVNAEFVELSGYTERELQEDGIRLFLEDVRHLFLDACQCAAEGNEKIRQELQLTRADHEVRWVEVSFSVPVREKSRTLLVMTLWDIQAYKSVEFEQRKITRRYEAMEKFSKEYPFDLDVEKWVMLRSHRLMELRGDCEAQDVYYPVEEEGKITRIEGRSFNIDTDKNLKEEVRRDPLTRLLNKVEVEREIRSFLEKNPEGTHVMLLIDIDDFKGVNDNFGHTFGDTVITDVARLIQSQFRSDDVVGRIGGDEFLVFMKNTVLDKATDKVQRLQGILCKEYAGGDVRYRISVSIGVAISSDDNHEYQKLFEQADTAMYRAKKNGKNGFAVADGTISEQVPHQTRKIEPREMIGPEDQKFIAYAVSLMAHAKNLDGSLNMLLERIAKRYRLAMVAILEWNQEAGVFSPSNYYSDSFDLPSKMTFKSVPEELEGLEPGQCASLTMRQMAEYGNLEGYANDLEAVARLRGEFSVVVGKYEYVEKHNGQIVYLSTDEHRQWSGIEMEMFEELTRILAVFASLRFRMDMSQEQICDIQSRDQLTGLYNQDIFRQRVAEILGEAEPDKIYGLVYMDINNFGYVNENYGYRVGDEVLKMFAQGVTEQSCYCAGSRLYSDFFLLLMEDENEKLLKEHLRGHYRHFANMQNHRYPNSGMGVTAGLYIFENPGVDVDVAIENANLAWKQAKNEKRRDIVRYEPKFRIARSDEQRVVGEFFEALYRDDFQIYLQPKFILGEHKVYGAEALARWKKPDGSVLTPFYFINALEKIGYITELDFYIFEEVLKTRKKCCRIMMFKNRCFNEFLGKAF